MHPGDLVGALVAGALILLASCLRVNRLAPREAWVLGGMMAVVGTIVVYECAVLWS